MNELKQFKQEFSIFQLRTIENQQKVDQKLTTLESRLRILEASQSAMNTAINLVSGQIKNLRLEYVELDDQIEEQEKGSLWDKIKDKLNGKKET